MQNDGGSDAAAAFVEAAKCYQKTNKAGVHALSPWAVVVVTCLTGSEAVVWGQTWCGYCTRPSSTIQRMAG